MQQPMISIRIIRSGSIEGRPVSLYPDNTQIDEPVDRTQQVVGRHVVLDAEAVKRFLHHRPLAHHQKISRQRDQRTSGCAALQGEFFNGIRPLSAMWSN